MTKDNFFHIPEIPFDISPELIDNLPSAIAILALNGTVRAVNHSALKLLNFHTSEVIGRHFTYFLQSIDPPLLTGGFQKLLELGEATFDIALRCGDNNFVQVEMRLVVVYDEQAQASGVLVMSGEGDAEHYLLRQAIANVADRVSRMIAYDPSGEKLWPKLFALCQELFEIPGGWLTLRGQNGESHIDYRFGFLGHFEDKAGESDGGGCPCTDVSTDVRGGKSADENEPRAVNSMDCPWLAPHSAAVDESMRPRHHGVVPILTSTGEHVGNICLIAPSGRIFHRHELMLMDAITDQIGQALDRGEIHFPVRLDRRAQISLAGVNTDTHELSQLLEQILANLSVLVPFVSAGVFLQERDGLRLMGAVDHPNATDLRGQFYPYTDNLLFQEIAETQKLLLLADVTQDPRFQPWGSLDYIRGWMGLPLLVNDKVIGVITLNSEQVGGFNPQSGVIAQAFADQAAIAVEKAQLVNELRMEKRSLELLHQLNQNLIAILEPKAVADKALELVCAAFNDSFGEIYLAESAKDLLQLLATHNHTPAAVKSLHGQSYLRPGVGIVGSAIEMRRPVLIPDVIKDPRWFFVPELDLSVRSMAAVPLIARNELVGALVLSNREVGIFNHNHHSPLQSIAASVALALQNARLFAAERQGRQEAEMLQNAIGVLTLDLHLEQILRILLERLRQVVPFDSACVMILEGQELHAVAELDLPRPEEILGHRFPVDNSFFASIQSEQRALYFEDVQKVPKFHGWGGTSTTRGWMGVPMIHRGEVLGYITLDSLSVGAYGAKEAAQAQAFANQMATTLVNAQLLRDSQQSVFEQQEVSNLLRRLNGAASFADIQSAAATGLHRLIGPSAVEIALYQPDEQQVVAERTFWADETNAHSNATRSYEFGESAALVSLLQGKSHSVLDLNAEHGWPVEEEWLALGYGSSLALPLQGNDHRLGHIQLFWREWPDPKQAIHFSLPQIAEGVALTVQKLRLLEQTTRRADELQALTQLSGALRIAQGREQITRIVLETCLSVLHADRGYLLMPVAGQEALEVIAHAGTGPIAPGIRYGYSDSNAGRVFCSGVPYCSPNLFADPLGHQPTLQRWAASGQTFVSALYAPLRAGEQIIGVLSLTNAETRRSFTPADLRLFNALGEIAGGALHRELILEGLEQRVSERTADLAQANTQLLELDQMKSDFVANVSHELRTPLTNIKLYLNLINNGRPERRDHYLQVILREVDQLHALIESILDLSALDESREEDEENFTLVPLEEIVQTVFIRLQERAETARIQLNFETPPYPLPVWGNRERLLHLGMNLVSNAINYTKPGGQVIVRMEKNGQGEVALIVQDTGIGIHPDDIGHIFERFYRGKQVRESEIPGTGLGLPIVNEILQTHKGRITVDSIPDEGTTFSVWFPPLVNPK